MAMHPRYFWNFENDEFLAQNRRKPGEFFSLSFPSETKFLSIAISILSRRLRLISSICYHSKCELDVFGRKNSAMGVGVSAL
jgi:hypothetical protein